MASERKAKKVIESLKTEGFLTEILQAKGALSMRKTTTAYALAILVLFSALALPLHALGESTIVLDDSLKDTLNLFAGAPMQGLQDAVLEKLGLVIEFDRVNGFTTKPEQNISLWGQKVDSIFFYTPEVNWDQAEVWFVRATFAKEALPKDKDEAVASQELDIQEAWTLFCSLYDRCVAQLGEPTSQGVKMGRISEDSKHKHYPFRYDRYSFEGSPDDHVLDALKATAKASFEGEVYANFGNIAVSINIKWGRVSLSRVSILSNALTVALRLERSYIPRLQFAGNLADLTFALAEQED